MSLVAAAAISAAGKLISSAIKRKQEKKAIKKQKEASLKQLDLASQMTAEEQQAMARMRRGAEQGTMDVERLNQQMAQPLYQQGEAQEAQAMQRITQQGLEGSIIAQDVSRKIGSDVRASIAQQARQIAMDNERTKAEAARRLSQAQMRRGQLLREIAMKRQGVKDDASLAQLISRQALTSGLVDAATGFATSAAENYVPKTGLENSSLEGTPVENESIYNLV